MSHGVFLFYFLSNITLITIYVLFVKYYCYMEYFKNCKKYYCRMVYFFKV